MRTLSAQSQLDLGLGGRFSLSAVVLALVACIQSAQPISAQQSDWGLDSAMVNGFEIRTGETVAGVLEGLDRRRADGAAFDLWIYRASQDRVVTIEARSAAFWPSVVLLDLRSEAETPVLASVDGVAESGTSRLTFRASRTGPVGIAVTAGPAGAGGPYRLVVATSEDGWPTDELASAPEDLPRWDLLYPGGGDPGGRYALLVGIGDYPGTDADILGPPEDVRAMADALTGRYGIPEENIVVLNDRAATKRHVQAAFARHLGQAGPDGLALFYYSGHGLQLYYDQGSLDTADDEPDALDEAIYLWGDVEGSVVLDDEIAEWISGLRAGRILLIMDSCFSGTVSRDRADPSLVRRVSADQIMASTSVSTVRAPPPGEDTRFRRYGSREIPDSVPGHVLLSASTAAQISFSRADGSGGVFTSSLVAAFREAADSASFETVMSRVQDEATRYTLENFGTRQTPQIEGADRTVPIALYLGPRPIR